LAYNIATFLQPCDRLSFRLVSRRQSQLVVVSHIVVPAEATAEEIRHRYNCRTAAGVRSVVLKNTYQLLSVAGAFPFIHGLAIRKLLYAYDDHIDVNALVSLAHLVSLYLSRSNIPTTLPLAALVNLKVLHLDYCSSLTNFEGLRQLVQLEILQVGYTNIETLNDIRCITQLKSLSMNGCRRLTDFAQLASLTALESLSLMQTSIESLSPLSGLIQLLELNLSGCQRLRDIDALFELVNLQALDLDNTNFSADDLARFNILVTMTRT